MNKEDALNEFRKMIEESWTYARFTKEEKIQWEETLKNVQTKRALKGTYVQRWEVLQAIYMSFLMALNYKPIGWRD